MCPYRVEVAQDGHLPARVRHLQVAQDVLAHEFGPAIGVGHLQAAALGDGHLFGVAIHGGGRAEDDVAHARPVHGLQQGQGAAHIVVKVTHRLRHRLAHSLEARKVDHAIDRLLGKESVEHCAIAHIGLYKSEVGIGQFLDAFQHSNAAVAQVVHDQHLVPCVQQFTTVCEPM